MKRPLTLLPPIAEEDGPAPTLTLPVPQLRSLRVRLPPGPRIDALLSQAAAEWKAMEHAAAEKAAAEEAAAEEETAKKTAAKNAK